MHIRIYMSRYTNQTIQHPAPFFYPLLKWNTLYPFGSGCTMTMYRHVYSGDCTLGHGQFLAAPDSEKPDQQSEALLP